MKERFIEIIRDVPIAACSRLDVYRDNMPEWAKTRETLQQEAVEAWNRRAENE
jgi:hypothetical protein